MSDQNAESNQERRQGLIDGSEKVKRSTPDDVADKETSTKKITDLNSYCLEHIFNYLELPDLVNVADSNSKLRSDCELPFIRNYRSKKVQMMRYGGWSTHLTYSNWFRIDTSTISIRNMIACLKLLRHFGHLLTNLSINFDESMPAHCAEVERYIHDNCAESLVEIDFGYAQQSTFSTIKKPFSKIEKVSFSDSELGKEICEFNKWFPNMRHLHFNMCDTIADLRCIEKPIPNLKHLELHINGCDKGFQKLNVLECLRLNQNLQIFALSNSFDGTFFELASRYLQNLQHLQINTSQESYFHNVDSRIRFENVKFLFIVSSRNEIIPKIPFTYGRLEMFNIIAGGIQSNDEFFRNHSLKKLKLAARYYSQSFEIIGEKLQLAKALPQLTEFSATSVFSVDEAIAFANECPMLKLFEFKLSTQSEYDDLESRFTRHSEWNASIKHPLIIQLQRCTLHLDE
ncbi:uncharacterized protein LOC129569476 isoform X1 [Sitodiplosis mosellana]|uniref:uncharacterized protein LOC129569476 isoform X1 n=1 Tax=Sitodiplosis mosellana TaxID=263140 RepID=UPI002443820B|nr:uncharacterized protein LOC129569476 isoform X1 [Sitodiplosis mosellana]